MMGMLSRISMYAMLKLTCLDLSCTVGSRCIKDVLEHRNVLLANARKGINQEDVNWRMGNGFI